MSNTLTQQIYLYKEEPQGRVELDNYINNAKAEGYTVLGIDFYNGTFTHDAVTHSFRGEPGDLDTWQGIFAYVREHGKFNFCICTNVLEKSANPKAILKAMPMVAKEGFIATTSKYQELQRKYDYIGRFDSRWISTAQEGKLVLYPKLNIIERVTFYPYGYEIEQMADHELRIFWKDTIDFEIKGENLYSDPEYIKMLYSELFKP